ncbi:6,7,8-trihydroxycoumarin synthase-like [Silene latifolia]|uniref:6,7,8-trihydroxycoumarin synthase-like n=1 Tax=Silene latifolia TaxID=37657 RepID=UPI003D773AF4
MLILLFIIVSPLIFLLLLGKLKLNREQEPPLRLPPGPKGLPFIGNLHQYDITSPHEYFAKLGKVYGPVVGLTFGQVPVVVVQSAEMAKEVLKTQDLNFCSRPTLIGMHRLSYNGLDIAFTPYGEYFREVKKLCIVHFFSSKRVGSYAPIRHEEVSRLIDKISLLSSTSQVVNLGELLMSYASSNICRIAFGKRYEEDQGPRSKFHSLLHEVQALFVGFFYADYSPYLGWLDKLTGQSSRLERLFKNMDKFYDELIRDHLDPNRHKAEDDIIDVLLKLKTKSSFSFELTFDHIKAILMNIFVAGTDTSTAMAVWAMMELVKNPKSLKKVQEEIRNVAQNKGCIGEDDLQKLEYFKAVVKETFRLHPAAPLLVIRESIRKTTLNGYDIKPKTLVHVNVWAIGRDPELWEDPEEFKPERFIGSSIDFRGQDFELASFGAGRRICPGMGIGLAYLELALANLLYSFNWELPAGLRTEDIDTKVLHGITMHKKNPLLLVAKKFPS